VDNTQIATGTKLEVLQAAHRVVLRDGVSALTLEAVAREAGRSKGGLLYHFPTKEALIQGLIADAIARFDHEVDRLMALDPHPGPGRWVRAFLSATTTESGSDYELTGGLLAAIANDPDLLAPMRTAYDRWQARALADGLDPVAATIVRLAADGFWLGDIFAFAPVTEPLRGDVVARLRHIASEPNSEEI
jgi:AcrR family transcriptional regulator